MSLDALRWALKQPKIKSSDKFVLVAMADRADERHRCWPSVERLASDTNLDRKTVIVAVTRLIAAGLLRASKREGRVTVYHLLGVEDRVSDQGPPPPENAGQTSPENGTGTRLKTSTKNGTGAAEKTSTKNGTGLSTTSTKNGTGPVPKTGHEPEKNRIQEKLAIASSSPPDGRQPRIAACPHREIIAAFNAMLPELPSVIPERWSGARAQNLAARWRESSKHQTPEFWSWFFGEVRKNRFLLGENDRGWRADLSWLVTRRNFDRILEQAVSAQRRRAAA